MSDPVKNVDIEDVLSSIRRLVSSGPDTARPKDESQSDKLVLTPSLRIDEAGGQGKSVVDEIVPEPDEAATQDVQTPAARDEGEREVSADPAHAPQDAPTTAQPNADASEERPEAASDIGAAEAESAPQDNADAHDPAAEHDPSGPGEVESDRFLGEVASALGAQAAEFEEEVAQREDQWEPDGTSDDDYAGGRVDSVDWQDATGDDLDDDIPASSDPDMEPADEAASYAYARAWEDVDSARHAGDPASEFVLDDAVIDEDTLRDMVAEIVRQELQGTLGERITRNVRKLVRREIHRALTSQDFE